MVYAQHSDEQLWNALRQGDEAAFAELYERFHATLYSYGYKIAANASLVEDAVQDLFVDLWRMRRSLSAANSVRFYLFRSLRRKIHVLDEQTHRFETPFFETNSPAGADSSVEQLLIGEEQESQLIRRLTQAIAQLPLRQQEVVALRFYQNFKTDEIAQIMGITEKSVRNTLHKALTHLREQASYLAPFIGLLLLWLLA